MERRILVPWSTTQESAEMEKESTALSNRCPDSLRTALPSWHGNSKKLDRPVVDRGHGSANHRLIHRDRKGEKQCHTLQSEKKIQETSSFTTKTMARANRLF
jgi:hypothetical protein